MKHPDESHEGRVSPGSEPLAVLPTQVAQADVEREVIRILSARTAFSTTEARTAAVQLLAAGYTPAEVSRRLKLHPGAVYDLARDPEVKAAVDDGVERRRSIVGHGLQKAALSAVDVLEELMLDPGVPPKERIKAAETLLERSGIAPDTAPAAATTAAVSVDVDFDNRLARIVAAGGATNLGD